MDGSSVIHKHEDSICDANAGPSEQLWALTPRQRCHGSAPVILAILSLAGPLGSLRTMNERQLAS